jgi:hypothetical protein
VQYSCLDCKFSGDFHYCYMELFYVYINFLCSTRQCRVYTWNVYRFTNIARELKGIRMKTKRIWVVYMTKFLWPTFHTFTDVTMSGPADITSLFNLCPRFEKEVDGNCSHCISYPPSKFRLRGRQRWQVHSILGVRPKEKIKGLRSGDRGGHVRGPPLPIHFIWNLAI